MRPLHDMPDAVAGSVRAVFTDIDDTLTLDGRLPAAAYQALEDLSGAGIVVVPVTGRPAGWCDLIARFWPVAGVVGENGAFYFAYDHTARQMRRVFAATPDERAQNRRKLDAIRDKILAEVPGSAVSADQAYREADLAIDVCEDVPPLPKSAVDRVLAIFAECGAQAKLSSIHVNGWFGAYDKLGMSRRLGSEMLGLDLDRDKEQVVFVGDSPNDAPMFGFFPQACGVANILGFADTLEAAPAYVAASRGGLGFVEVAHRILGAQAQRGAPG